MRFWKKFVLAALTMFLSASAMQAGMANAEVKMDSDRIEDFMIEPVQAGGVSLAGSFGGEKIEWSGDGISADGKVQEQQEDKSLVFTAKFSGGGEKQFQVKVLGAGARKMLAYTRKPLADSVYSGKLAYSMHLAVGDENGGYSPLYDNAGLLYAKAEIAANGKLCPKNLKMPYVFYMKDGGYGIVAVQTDSEKTAQADKLDASSQGKVLLFTTSDFIHYEQKGLIDLHTERYVSDVICGYDSSSGQYVIRWADTEGDYYKSTTGDVQGLDARTEPGAAFECEGENTGIEGAYERNTFYVSGATADKVQKKFSQIYNTGVSVPDITVCGEAGDREQVMQTKAVLSYSDGSTAEKAVDWNLDEVDFAREGTYYAKGTLKRAPCFKADNKTALGVNRADPCIYYNDEDGYYYFIATNDSNGNATFSVRKSETIEGLREAEENVILSVDDYSDVNMVLWAPEFHKINGQMYIFFAANPADGWNVQCFVMKLSGNDMADKDSWDKPIRFLGKDGKPLTEAGTIGGITLDMTEFETGGQHYVCWTQRNFGKATGSVICLGTIDPEEPWKLTSNPVILCRPDYGWDNNDDTPVDEGPYAIIHGDDIFITFSGSSVGATYCVGMLKASLSANLMDSGSWTKSNYPVLYPRAVEGEAGPGHNSYTTDESGNLVFVYHARPVDENGKVGSRNTGLRTVHFDADNEPVFYMHGDMEMAEEFENVTLKVTVTSRKAEVSQPPAAEAVAAPSPTPAGNSGEAAAKPQTTDEAAAKPQTTGEAAAKPQTTGEAAAKPQAAGEAAARTGKTYRVGDYAYTVTGKNTVSVKGMTVKKAKKIVIKASVKIKGRIYRVTAIEKKAFAGFKSVVSAVIGKNVVKIGEKSFYKCSGLKKIVFKGAKLKKAGKKALAGTAKKIRISAPGKKTQAYRKLLGI